MTKARVYVYSLATTLSAIFGARCFARLSRTGILALARLGSLETSARVEGILRVGEQDEGREGK